MDESFIEKLKKKEFPIPTLPNGIEVAYNNVPPKTIPISHIGFSHINKLCIYEGIIRSITPIYPSISRAHFQCESCRFSSEEPIKSCPVCQTKNIIQKGGKAKEVLSIILEENVAQSDSSKQPVSVPCNFIEGDLDLRLTIDSLRLGQKISVVGKAEVVRQAKRSIFSIEAQSYVTFEDGISSIKVTEEEKELMRIFVSRPDFQEKLRSAIFKTDLYGLDTLQDAIILQMASSPKRYIGKFLKNRGNIMLLLVGSPGRGKSALLKKTALFFPNSRYTSGSGASGIGLTASVSTDERVGQPILTPGALPLCHEGGILGLDELDKIGKDNLTKLNTQMDSLIVPIDKFTIHRKLPCDVSILAAMNPKYGTFDMSTKLWEQIDLKKDFLDRFDLIFNIDHFVKKEDILKLSKKNLESYIPEEEAESHITPQFIVKFFAYCRTIDPKIDYGVTNHIEQEYYSLVKGHREEDGAYFSVRLQETLMRLASAYARLRLSDLIDYVDVKQAVELLKEAFISLGVYHPDSGLDSYKTEQIINTKQLKGWPQIMYQAEKLGARTTPIDIEQIYSNCSMPRSEFEHLLEKGKEKGYVFEPVRGKMKLL